MNRIIFRTYIYQVGACLCEYAPNYIYFPLSWCSMYCSIYHLWHFYSVCKAHITWSLPETVRVNEHFISTKLTFAFWIEVCDKYRLSRWTHSIPYSDWLFWLIVVKLQCSCMFGKHLPQSRPLNRIWQPMNLNDQLKQNTLKVKPVIYTSHRYMSAVREGSMVPSNTNSNDEKSYCNWEDTPQLCYNFIHSQHCEMYATAIPGSHIKLLLNLE